MSLGILRERALRMPCGALFSHNSAAWLHGLDFPACDPVEVTLPRLSQTSHLAGVRLMRSDFGEDEASTVHGLPTTCPTRTIADLSRRGTLIESVVAVDMALRRKLVSFVQLRDWAANHPRHRGIRKLLRAVEFADAGSESPMETRLRVLLVLNGLPKPLVQQSLHDNIGSFIARADLLYRAERLVLEYDGALHRDTLAVDNRRQNRLIDAGYRVLRFTAADIVRRPASTVGLVQRALGHSSGSPN